MIAAFGGDVVGATLAFARYCLAHEPDVKVVSLVDYHNDVVRDALAVARAMHDAFGAVSYTHLDVYKRQAWWGASGVGTMPHAMIAAFGGDVVGATLAFARYCLAHEPDVKVVSLVDYHNDVVRDALAVARAMHDAFGAGSLVAVRVDTSERLVDVALAADAAARGREGLTGVNPELVRRLRSALDQGGFPDVGIIVSGGFTPAKIRRFEREGVPVTGYGIGSSLLGHNDGEQDGLLNDFDFTADVVMVDGRLESKVGRGFVPNARLVPVDIGALGNPDARA